MFILHVVLSSPTLYRIKLGEQQQFAGIENVLSDVEYWFKGIQRQDSNQSVINSNIS